MITYSEETSEVNLSGNPFWLFKYVVGPLQFVAITGTAHDIASTWGRPHPSP